MKKQTISWVMLGLLSLLVIGLGYSIKETSTKALVVVKWSTASELDTVGYNLYRSETSTDPGIRMNVDLIAASEDSQTGGDYQYRDTNVKPGKVYYYYLEDVSSDGTTSRHGPVVVKAQAGGRIEWILTFALVAVTLVGIGTLIWPRRKYY
jgi:hypothetical protein